MSKDKQRFLPLNINPSALAERAQPLLSPISQQSTDATRSPSLAPAAVPDSATPTRGIYSEFILKEDFLSEPTTLSKNAALPPIPQDAASNRRGISINSYKRPAKLMPIKGNYVSTAPGNYKVLKSVPAATVNPEESVVSEADLPKKKLDYRRALEPKVQLPHSSR